MSQVMACMRIKEDNTKYYSVYVIINFDDI